MRSALFLSTLCAGSLLGVTGEGSANRDQSQPDIWAPVRGLVGTWEGTSEGKFGPAKLEVTWEFVLDGKFLKSTTTSVSDAEVHQDLGMLSYDKERERFVQRAFYSEGYVNRYVLDISADGKTLEFETEFVENGFAPGLRARDTVTFVGADRLTGSLALATGDRPYEICVSTQLVRRMPVVELSGLRLRPPAGCVRREPASSSRAAEFTLGSAGGVGSDASLTVYYFGPGRAGSVEANIDRWCGQFAQPDGRDSKDVAKLDVRSINGLRVHTLDLGGTYVAETRPGSGERVNEPGSHLLAAIVDTDAGPYYLKLIGPAATVDAWRESYHAMLAALEPGPVPDAATDADIGHP